MVFLSIWTFPAFVVIFLTPFCLSRIFSLVPSSVAARVRIKLRLILRLVYRALGFIHIWCLVISQELVVGVQGHQHVATIIDMWSLYIWILIIRLLLALSTAVVFKIFIYKLRLQLSFILLWSSYYKNIIEQKLIL